MGNKIVWICNQNIDNEYFSRKKRSVGDVTPELDYNDVDTTMLSVLEATELVGSLQQFLESLDIRSHECQLRTVCHMYQAGDQVASDNVSVRSMVRMVVDTFTHVEPETELLTRDWTRAADMGRGGAQCQHVYPNPTCDSVNYEEKLKTIQS